MVVINYNTREVSCKIVFYGPGLSGKTTNLQYIHSKVPGKTRGDLISLATDADRTLYFDFLPINIGDINGFTTKFQIYTVPGQVFYNATRKLVLRGVDGIIFVADSQRAKADENVESLNNLKENLAEYGVELSSIPIVLQYNKRDLPDVMSVDELNQLMNELGWPVFEAAAPNGVGVFDTLKFVIKLVLDKAKKSPDAKDSEQSERVEDAQLSADDDIPGSGGGDDSVRVPAAATSASTSGHSGPSTQPAHGYGALAASEESSLGDGHAGSVLPSSVDEYTRTSAHESLAGVSIDIEVAESPTSAPDAVHANQTDRIPVIRENQLRPVGITDISDESMSGSEASYDTSQTEDSDSGKTEDQLYGQLPSFNQQPDDELSADVTDNNGIDAFSVPTMQKSLRQKRRKKKGFFLFRWLFRRG
ncbi:MAG: hypothetical protein KKG33_07565 [candidate division Zixibacteria bacterium]|nr:hypothetical protein [candidate division Zixibacteria bacterium]MBU1471701.1 hypothetical protein [candidate division Zixibacteria bacterium]MBU2625403.1 hypothetical protein [candidate division Zixibacteria bacterium]